MNSTARGMSQKGAGRTARNPSFAYLRSAEVFLDLTDQELEAIHRFLPMRDCPRGTLFYQPGEPAERLFILKKGRVMLYRLTPDGHRIVVGTVHPGTIFGEMALAGLGMQDCFAEAQDDALVCVATRGDMQTLITRHPEIAFRLLSAFGKRVLSLEDQLEQMAFRPVSARLAELLLKWAGDENGGWVVRGYTHEDLANAIGAARQTVSSALKQLEGAGYIAVRRRAIAVLDHEHLQQLVAACVPRNASAGR
jgi:CRP-like cAMP-binding protein